MELIMKPVWRQLITICLVVVISAVAIKSAYSASRIEHSLNWPNGQVKEKWSEIRLDDSTTVKDGDYGAWYEDGGPCVEGRYVKGNESGKWTWWYRGGHKKAEGQYENGVLKGQLMKWGDIREFAWCSLNAGGIPHPVCTKAPNSFGIYDMYGNASEYCSDWYINWEGTMDFKAVMGGSFLSWPYLLRSDHVTVGIPDMPEPALGFRCACDSNALKSNMDFVQMALIPSRNMKWTTGDAHGSGSDSGLIKSFWIDIHEVTNKQFRKYLAAARENPVSCWLASGYDDSSDSLPRTYVSWYQAEGYCKWAGKRLPSVAEWESASRGVDASLPYEFGNLIGDDGIAGVTEPSQPLLNIDGPLSGPWIAIDSPSNVKATMFDDTLNVSIQKPSGAFPMMAVENRGIRKNHASNEFRLDSLSCSFARSTKYVEPSRSVVIDSKLITDPREFRPQYSTEKNIKEEGGGKFQFFFSLIPGSQRCQDTLQVEVRWIEYGGGGGFFLEPPLYTDQQTVSYHYGMKYLRQCK